MVKKSSKHFDKCGSQFWLHWLIYWQNNYVLKDELNVFVKLLNFADMQ